MTSRYWPDPTPAMLENPTFNAIWNVIKTWDINVPSAYEGYCGATGNHARAIFDALAFRALSGAGAAEPVAWRWQHVNDRREPRPWHYEDAPWHGNEYMQAEPLYAVRPVRGDREALSEIAALNITPDTGASTAMLMRRIASEALSNHKESGR